MNNELFTLGELVKARRNLLNITQEQAAEKSGADVNRSVVAHLEQGLRVPKPDQLKRICEFLGVPPSYWIQFTNDDSVLRFQFEEGLSEMVGYPVSIAGHEAQLRSSIESLIRDLFTKSLTTTQARDLLNSILVFYGGSHATQEFFDRYLGPNAFRTALDFHAAVEKYQTDAIRLFSTLYEAYQAMNGNRLTSVLQPLSEVALSSYHERSDWSVIEEIEDSRLPDLGYISAARVKQESAERLALHKFLLDLAAKLKGEGKAVLGEIPEKTKRRMDSLLRQFDSSFKHGLFSPLFSPDVDELVREAHRLAPKTDIELARMQETQDKALRNLGQYLSADHLDIYVATSMRNDADFISVNQFVKGLFSHPKIRSLKLRYFNPTQSWIDDRIAKGLVEALMLRRSSLTIYMAQKSDTFGKDSEASVALGQGKPVIVYVPKLALPGGGLDTELLSTKTRNDLLKLLDVNEQKETNTVRFENRAKMFREIHPLALQIVLSTGVLNGILVVRSVQQCATVLENLVRNHLDLKLAKDAHNYRLIELNTGSTIRVISRHRLLRHAFQAFYSSSKGV
jgi:transcriptional regulator with XRE-family HTH domain